MTAVFNDNVVTTATLPPLPLSKTENYGRGHSLNGCSPLAYKQQTCFIKITINSWYKLP